MDYKELKKIYYSQHDRYEAEYQLRLQGYSALNTNLFPRLMKRDQFETAQYPLFVTLLPDLVLLMERIQDASQQIVAIAESLPDIAIEQFYREQLYQSIISTNEIEGVKTTRKELAEAEQVLGLTDAHIPKVKHLSTLRMYKEILDDSFLHIHVLTDIRDIYDRLTEGEIEAENNLDGQIFRSQPVFIRDDKTGKLIHLPPQTEEGIQSMLQAWISFINSSQIPFLIKACLGHYFFENIHPFYDGNGRTGRYILAKYLSRRLDRFSGLVISQQINLQKQNYYKAFQTTSQALNRADGTFFVLRCLQFIHDGQEQIISTLLEKRDMLAEYQSKISQEEVSEAEQFVLFLLAQSKLFVDIPAEGLKDRDILTLSRESGYSQRVLRESLHSLTDKGLLQVVSKKPLQHTLSDNF